MAPTPEPIILTNQEDWEPWIEYLESITDEDVWPHIDPEATGPPTTTTTPSTDESDSEDREDNEPQVKPLLKMPTRPEISDFDSNVTTYV